jgi:hypothetical protein
MKTRLLLVVALLSSAFPSLYAQSTVGRQNVDQFPISSSGNTEYGLTWLPTDYSSTTTTYPLIVFLHGAGQAGTGTSGLSKLITLALPQFIANGFNPEAVNPVDGQNYKFIVVSPQASGWSTSSTQLNYVLSNIVSRYRVDVNRIYLTGLSAGGEGVTFYTCHIDENGTVNPNYKAAAIVPMSAAIGTPQSSWGVTTVNDNVHVWGFGSINSDIHGENTYNYVNYVNAASAGFGRFTNYSGGHCCWNTFYDPNYRETVNGKSMNIYEWMLQFSRTGGIAPPQNQPPVANAGPDQSITLPANSVNVNGTGTDADGSISAYNWTWVSGPSQYSISNPRIANPTISNLTSGNYSFRLTVTDNKGATGSDDINIVVNAAPPPPPPSGTAKNVRVNLYAGANPYTTAGWNNWNVDGTAASNMTFKYDDGTSSTIAATLNNTGTITDNGSSYPGGMAPAPVLRYASYAEEARTLTFTGLSTSATYSLEFYASRGANSGQQTTFTINGTMASVSTYNNYSNKALFSNIVPDAQGQIVVTISKTASYNYVNGFSIIEQGGASGRANAMGNNSVESNTASIDITPNPAQDKFIVQVNNNLSGAMNIQIVGNDGKLVQEYNLNKTDEKPTQVYLSANDLPSGEYSLKIKMGEWSSSKKLIRK